MRRYGLTPKDYDEFLARQGGRCAICGTDDPPVRGKGNGASQQLKKLFVVDHCHITGRVRGLLCRKCNTGIGGLDDDPRLVRSALKYLEGFEQEVELGLQPGEPIDDLSVVGSLRSRPITDNVRVHAGDPDEGDSVLPAEDERQDSDDCPPNGPGAMEPDGPPHPVTTPASSQH